MRSVIAKPDLIFQRIEYEKIPGLCPGFLFAREPPPPCSRKLVEDLVLKAAHFQEMRSQQHILFWRCVMYHLNTPEKLLAIWREVNERWGGYWILPTSMEVWFCTSPSPSEVRSRCEKEVERQARAALAAVSLKIFRTEDVRKFFTKI